MKTVRSILERYGMVFPLACLATVAIMLVSEYSYWHSAGKLDQVGVLRKSQNNLQQLIQGIVDAETGTRGFLLTGRRDYLEPYQDALARISLSMAQIEQRFGAEPESEQGLHWLRELIATRLSELALTIDLVEQGKASATSEILGSGIGREKMDGIRTISGDLLEREERGIHQGREDIYRALWLSRIGMIALSLSGLLALFMYRRQTVALKLQQLQQKRLVQAERDRLEVEVMQRTAQLTELTLHIQTAREDERHRLARNLHDDLGALLTSAKLDAARIKSRISVSSPEALDLLAHLVDTLNSGIALGRRIIEDLRPSALGNLGLAASLEILAREFAVDTGVEISCALEPVELGASSELIAYRLVQEALTNITKYAKAHMVWIELAAQDGKVEVSVRDDGVGFDTELKRASAYGLVGMRFRVEASGGTLSIVSTPGKGTLVCSTLPIKPPAVDGESEPPDV